MGENLAKLISAISPGDIREFRRDLRSAILEVSRENAVFKAKVAEGYRITIPEAERESTDLKVGDLVQVVAVPLGEKE